MIEEVKFMVCAQFEELVHDLERPGTEGFALRDSALEHAESCSHCARLMTDAEALDAALREVARSEANNQAPARVGTALMGEFRRQKMVASRRRVQRQIAALAVAAVVLLVLGISLHRWTAPKPNVVPDANVTGNTSTLPTISPLAAPVNSDE